MLSLDAPLWLAGWLVLPLVRWLHRGGRHLRVLPVARLGLWQAARAAAAPQGHKQPPDPAWRRRALLAALLTAALAGPHWDAPRNRVTLWVDDALSLLTRESQGTRLELGLSEARLLLQALPGAEVEVRTLGDPWQAHTSLEPGATAALATALGRHAPAPPPSALLAPGRQHWLLTDGVNAQAGDWPDGVRPDRVLRVGSVQRNVGLQRLAARRSADDPERLDLSVDARNGGTAPESRLLRVSIDGMAPLQQSLQMEPGGTARVRLTLPAGAPLARLRATLQPADALAEDDMLDLDLTPLRRHAVADDPACPAALRAAVAAHPALQPVPAGTEAASAALECSGPRARAGTATLGVHADRLPAAVRGLLQWSAAPGRRLALPPDSLRMAGRLHLLPRDEVLLSAGAVPLVVARAGSVPRLDTVLDFDAMAAARSSDVPLLVNLLFERLLGLRLLDGVALVERPAQASRVVPAPASASSIEPRTIGAAGPAPRAPPARDLARPLLWAAMLVLLWEMLVLVRQALRQRLPLETGSP